MNRTIDKRTIYINEISLFYNFFCFILLEFVFDLCTDFNFQLFSKI